MSIKVSCPLFEMDIIEYSALLPSAFTCDVRRGSSLLDVNDFLHSFGFSEEVTDPTLQCALMRGFTVPKVSWALSNVRMHNLCKRERNAPFLAVAVSKLHNGKSHFRTSMNSCCVDIVTRRKNLKYIIARVSTHGYCGNSLQCNYCQHLRNYIVSFKEKSVVINYY